MTYDLIRKNITPIQKWRFKSIYSANQLYVHKKKE